MTKVEQFIAICQIEKAGSDPLQACVRVAGQKVGAYQWRSRCGISVRL
jgi:hypothetical protein